MAVHQTTVQFCWSGVTGVTKTPMGEAVDMADRGVGQQPVGQPLTAVVDRHHAEATGGEFPRRRAVFSCQN